MEEMELQGKWVIVCESVGQGSHNGDRFVYRCNGFWGDGNTWSPQAHLSKPQLFDTRNDAIERTKLITLGTDYQLGVIQATKAERWVTAKVNATATYTQEQLDERVNLARQQGKAAGRDERDEWFAEQVLEYRAGCDEGKREFLESIGLEQYAVQTVEFTFSVTVEANDPDDVASDVEREIDSVDGVIDSSWHRTY
jgi:hypothetical protein